MENDVSLLYRSLADKVESPSIKAILSEIADDSQRHAKTFRDVSESIAKTKIKPKDCEKTLGETWHVTAALSKEIAKKEKITEDELAELTEKLSVFESVIGEEYHVFIQLKTLSFMSKEIGQLYNVNLEQFQKIFSEIIDDEEHHRELLGTIRELISQKEKELVKNP